MSTAHSRDHRPESEERRKDPTTLAGWADVIDSAAAQLVETARCTAARLQRDGGLKRRTARALMEVRGVAVSALQLATALRSQR